MSEPRRIDIATAPPYPVLVGPGLLADCGRLLAERIPPCRAAVVTDSNVGPLYLDRVLDSLRQAGYAPCSKIIPAGEHSKSLQGFGALLEWLAAEGLTRADCVLALGGGVVGDLSGFAAGCYLRGVAFALLPTTLLAAVDAAVGGKSAVDLSAGKNLAGLIRQPAAVLCDTDCFRSLPKSVYAEGMAEAVKTGVLAGEPLFSLCAGPGDDGERVALCVAYKGGVTARDERESGERRLLNLGHTAAHAIERLSDYAVPHGQAVAAGLGIIARASAALGWSDGDTAARIQAALQYHGLPVTTDYAPAALAAAALSDKKRAGERITLIIPRRIGDCVQRTVAVSELEAVFRAGMEG